LQSDDFADISTTLAHSSDERQRFNGMAGFLGQQDGLGARRKEVEDALSSFVDSVKEWRLNSIATEDQVIQQLVQWAEHEPLVRAVILTSSRAIPHAHRDSFSDYDVILALRKIESFYDNRNWLETFGSVLALYRDPLILDRGLERSAYVIQYECGLKIDFSLWPVELLKQIANEPQLPPEFDAGYQVLLDKDYLTDRLPPPTYASYIPKPPTETQYQTSIEEFFLDTTYVAKFLWRDDLIAAKFILDHSLKQNYLLPMLEWRIEIDHEWSVKPGPYGRELKRWLPSDMWADLKDTYTGAELDSNWSALFRTIGLMRRVAIEVGQRLGYSYPDNLERRVVSYLQRVRKSDRK
jgi:aminoglycoside 6-adenylyltransferase